MGVNATPASGARRGTPGRRAIASTLVGLGGVALLVLALRAPASPLEAAAAWCRAHARAGDVVVAVGCVTPDDVLRFAPARAMCADAPSLRSLAPYRRVLVANASPTLATLLDARFGPPSKGGAGVRVYRATPALLDLRASLDRASVSRGGTPCPRRGARHACSGASWRTVEPRRVTVGGLALDCVFAHPSEDGLAIEVPLPAGVRRVRGVAGLSDRAAARRDAPPIDLRTGPLLSALANRRGLQAFSFTPVTQTMVLELRTTSQGARSLCLQAWAVP